jgi:hypothetical protein
VTHDCHCGGSCCQDKVSTGGLGWLGALTPEQAADTVFPQSMVRDTPGFNQHVRDCIVQAAQGNAFACFVASGCSGVSAGGNIKIATTVSTLALTGVEIGLVAAHVAMTVLGPLTMGISTLIGLFGMFFAHHAAKVALEQKIVCASVPAANNYLQVIDQAVRSGRVDPQHGIQALQSLQNDFANQVSAIIKNDSSHCNAACVWTKELAAIVAEMSSQYQDLAAQAAQAPPPASLPSPGVPSPVTVTRPNTVSVLPGQIPAAPAGSLPSWLPLAAALVGGLFLVRSL